MAKKLLFGAIVVALALAPVVRTHAAGTTVIHNITFPTGTNGCTGTIIPVYGSSAIKTFILKAAANYCNTFATKSTAPDVEYASGGDSCPGVDWASDFNDANEVGTSDAFASACSGAQARSAASITDNNVAVNLVESIMQCPGATDLQGGSPHPPTTDTQCKGSATTASPACPAAIPSLYFPAPNNESVIAAQQVWNTQPSDWAQINGCAGNAPGIQQRVAGSGTRVTWCDNIFGPGLDASCLNNTAAGAAATTGVMLTDVCGNPYTSPATAAVDAAGTIGYSSRAGIVVDPRQPSGGLLPLSNCGLIQLNGKTGYNGTCDPTNSATFTAANSGINNESNVATCNGDLDVLSSQYPAWGYEHLDISSRAGGNVAAAQAFVNWITTGAAAANNTLFQQQGFMLNCQMQVQRSVDGGGLIFTPGATC